MSIMLNNSTLTMLKPVAWRVHPFDYGIGHKGVYAKTSELTLVASWERKGWKVEPLYTAQALRDVLEQAVQKIFSIEMPIDEDNFEAGIMYAADAVRTMIKDIT